MARAVGMYSTLNMNFFKTKNAGAIALSTILFALNLLVVCKMLGVEYSAYQESNEASFIAIARQISFDRFGQSWWPFWACGIPFKNTYLPLLHLVVGTYSKIFGVTAGLAFHQVCALCFCLSPVATFWLAVTLTGNRITSFVSAVAYSLLSPLAVICPKILQDLGSVWNLRRLQILGYYGEGPYSMALLFIPLSVLFLYRAAQTGKLMDKVLAGLFLGLAVLSNAFAATVLAIACIGILGITQANKKWEVLRTLLLISVGSYCWISPLVPPSVLNAIRINSPTVDGDYRFTLTSAFGLGLLILLWGAFLLISRNLPSGIRFAWSWAIWLVGIVVLGVNRGIFIVPQPHRYEVAAELALCIAMMSTLVYFFGERLQNYRHFVAVAALAVFVALAIHAIRYGSHLIQPLSHVEKTPPYRIAKWVDSNMGGQRVMISGSYSFHFNAFTDSPQLHGAQDTMLPNPLLRYAIFAIYSGMNAGARDTEISVLWLKALGAHAISVPGSKSLEYYKPFANPRKFEGTLPVLWKEGDDTIYGIPGISPSLAHPVSEQSLVRHPPQNGLDISEVESYVSALERSPVSALTSSWTGPNRLVIDGTVRRDAVVSVQVNAGPGWNAVAAGQPAQLMVDGLGLIYLKTDCDGPCHIIMTYAMDTEGKISWATSIFEMLTLGYLFVTRSTGIQRY